MRKLTLLFLFFFSINSYCQKQIGKPENKISQRFYENLDSLKTKYDLRDLRETDTPTIRIWSPNEIISLEENPQYIFHSDNGQKAIIEKRSLPMNFNLDSLFQVFRTTSNTKNDQIHIDAFPITIELNNSNSYNLISFYKNEQLEEIIKTIRKENSIGEVRKEIISNLPAGNYRYGMTGLKIDHLPKQDKSDFYKKIESEILKKLRVTEKNNPTEMPLIVIDNIPRFFKDLNDLTLSDVKDYEIINDNRKLIYGTRGRLGIIKVNTN
ncbi:hypothetical protein LB465_02790 [Salegentibacter sp. LM13S]|uniref:hypothetical protein n=1 Tax=Salegentibacter lacus TaxID=2873599 RepID=UPI001CCFEF72|nr:hypothetical protein [Salegentibacter lacus]MBZ9629692.1 hypothetical protein [Salegentibacter lacus]